MVAMATTLDSLCVLPWLQVYRMNKAAAELAKRACKDVEEATGECAV